MTADGSNNLPLQAARPIAPGVPIGLIQIGWKGRLAKLPRITKLAESFNRAQGDIRAFNFVPLPDIIDDVGPPPAGKHCHSNATYFDKLASRKSSSVIAIIGVTSDELEDNRFNAHDVTRRVGIVTIKDMEEVRPVTMSVLQYICYLILCEAFCVVGQKHFETDDSMGCLFDRCDDKKWLQTCLLEPKICHQSKNKLLEDGFDRQYLVVADKVLEEFVGHKKWIPPVPRDVVAWIFGCASGFLVHFSFERTQHLGPKAAWYAMALVVILLVACFVLLKQYPGHHELPGGE